MQIRIAEAADLEPITRLINLAFQVERFFIEGDRITQDGVRSFADKGKFVILNDSEGLAGCVYVEPRGQRAYLGLLSVDPSRQRGGIGSRLVKAAEDYCLSIGCRFLDLRIVSLRQELPAFYRRLGYQETGTSPFPEDVHTKLPCHFVNMTKALARANEACV